MATLNLYLHVVTLPVSQCLSSVKQVLLSVFQPSRVPLSGHPRTARFWIVPVTRSTGRAARSAAILAISSLTGNPSLAITSTESRIGEEPDLAVNVSRNRLTSRLVERFTGHGLHRGLTLVAR